MKQCDFLIKMTILQETCFKVMSYVEINFKMVKQSMTGN